LLEPAVRDTEPTMPEESTTPHPVDMIRRVFETFSRGDLEASISFFSPNAVWEGLDIAVGRARIRALWEDYARSAGDLQIDLKEVVDYGHGVLLALTGHTGHPQGSNYVVRADEAYVYQCSMMGLIDHVTAYPDIDEGRAAAERLAQERG
jgi:ketosteroid isomerase-like protein